MYKSNIVVSGQEGITGGLLNINTDHAAIHLGYGSLADDYFTLASGGIKQYCFTTPSDLFVHFKNIVFQSMGGSAKLEIIRGATVTVNTGTDLLITNPNDNVVITSSSTIKATPTYTSGTVWKRITALSEATRQSVGNADISDNPNQELVMKADNEQYIIKITNLTTDTITVAWNAFWYEEPKGSDSE